jgi:hypothetical protein
MNKATSTRLFFIVSLIMSSTAYSQINEASEEEDYVSYEKIVDDLQSRTKKQPASQSSTRYSSGRDPFENVWIHAGVGIAQTTQNIDLPNGATVYMAGRGVQATLGIDILGPNLSAEGSVRNFGESEDSPMGVATKTALKEFDLKVLVKTREGRFGFKGGGGLSARYMTVRSGLETFDITTPASVLQVGGDFYLSQTVSLGVDLAVRTAMITETFDRTSYDGTLRLDTHF